MLVYVKCDFVGCRIGKHQVTQITFDMVGFKIYSRCYETYKLDGQVIKISYSFNDIASSYVEEEKKK